MNYFEWADRRPPADPFRAGLELTEEQLASTIRARIIAERTGILVEESHDNS